MDKNKSNSIFIGIIAGLCVLMIGYIVWNNMKYSCKEGTCEKVLMGGVFSSKKECEDSCNKKPVFYACDKNTLKCVESDQGSYSNKQDCLQDCKKVVTTTYYTPRPPILPIRYVTPFHLRPWRRHRRRRYPFGGYHHYHHKKKHSLPAPPVPPPAATT